MASAGTRSPREKDAGETTLQMVAHGLATLQETVQQTEQRMKEALSLQRQEASRRLREAKREVEAKLERREERVANLERRSPSTGKRRRVEGGGESEMEAKHERLEERVVDLDSRSPPAGKRRNVKGFGERSAMRRILEERLSALEASVQRALDRVFPSVNNMLTHMESQSPLPRMPLPIPSTATHSVTSSSASLVAGEPQPSTSSAPPPPLAHPPPREVLGNELLLAARDGQMKLVRTLLDSGADVNYSNARGWTPLMSACSQGWGYMVTYLIQRGANIHATRGSYSWTALHEAAESDRSGRCVRLLLSAGARVDRQDSSGCSPLHVAAAAGNRGAVEALEAVRAFKKRQ